MSLFAPQQTLAQDRYTIQQPLSQGGMGDLYLATDHSAFDRTVVVKTMLPAADTSTLHEQQAAQTDFLHEARTLAALRYPHIPQIFAYFQEGPHTCIVMEYIEGRDLSQGLSYHDPQTDQPVPGQAHALGDVMRWSIALCRMLEYLEQCQPSVVHQDIKPANLVLAHGSNELYLVDFGAARLRTAFMPNGNKTAIFGTPGYAAPEQYRGQSEPRSDVYALAATLYHLATDDDPTTHPFSFPRFNHLGYFGTVLREALHPDATQRPTAAALRRNLEALLLPDTARALPSPHGFALQHEHDLAAWCERNWQQAAEWLYTELPAQVQAHWVRLDLAQALRQCVTAHPQNRDAGLDAALAYLDPNGYGQARLCVQADRTLVDFEEFAPRAKLDSHLRLHNTGRRYVQVDIGSPDWLTVTPNWLNLRPGQQIELSFQPAWDIISYHKLLVYNRLRGTLAVKSPSEELLTIDVQGSIHPRRKNFEGLTPHQARVIIAVLLFCFLVSFVQICVAPLFLGS